MSRLRQNGIWSGSTNLLTISATGTTVNFVSAPLFVASIAYPDLAVIIAEPDTPNEEIMWLLGWTLGATSGFVQRAAEAAPGGVALNSPIAHTSVQWRHGPTAYDYRQPSQRHFARSNWR